jgi:ubiquinone/menaquinone biosynthesis C-methylase UbiE
MGKLILADSSSGCAMTRKNLLVSTKPEAYDKWAEDGTREWTRALVARIEADAKGDQGSILDVGMGTGHLLLALSRIPKLRGWTLIGLDIDPAMVNFAAQRLCQEDPDGRVIALVGDVHRLPFEDGTVDRVVGRSIVHHWSDPAVAFGEIHRILGADGRALIHEPLRDARIAALARFNASRRAASLPDMSHAEKYTADEIATLLSRARLAGCSVVHPGEGAILGLGCEIRICKQSSAARPDRAPV